MGLICERQPQAPGCLGRDLIEVTQPGPRKCFGKDLDHPDWKICHPRHHIPQPGDTPFCLEQTCKSHSVLCLGKLNFPPEQGSSCTPPKTCFPGTSMFFGSFLRQCQVWVVAGSRHQFWGSKGAALVARRCSWGQLVQLKGTRWSGSLQTWATYPRHD